MNYKEIKYTFFSFLAFMTIISIVGRIYGFNEVIYGQTLLKHITDLMSEHEAVKSLNILSLIFICISLFTGILSKTKHYLPKITPYFTKVHSHFMYPMLNFICTLAAVSLAITISVFISSLGMVGAWPGSLIILVVNAVLTVTFILSIHFFNLRPFTCKNMILGIISTVILILILFR